MASPTSTLSIHAVRRVSTARKVSVTGLTLTAAGMLLQIGGGSTLYPSVIGPTVLLVTAGIVAFVPGRWPALLGLLVPTVLAAGAIVAAAMTGEFISQLLGPEALVVFLGSVIHVVGLVAAIAGGARMVVDRRTTPNDAG